MTQMSLKELIFKCAENYSLGLSQLPAEVRVGYGYNKASREIREAEHCDVRMAESRLLAHLQKLLNYASTHVAFYRDFYRKKGYSPKALQSLDDWAQVPVVTKQDLQEVPLVERCVPGRVGLLSNTGGTSGAPLAFMLERNATPLEWAHMHHIWSARGYHVSQLKLRIGGTYFNTKTPLSYHPRHNEYIVNANCSMHEIVDAVLELSERKRFRWVHGYPSLVAEFAQALSSRRSAASHRFVAHLNGVLLGSEFPAQVYREPITKLLSSNIVSWYGHSEMALLAKESMEGVYQSLPTYGYAEAVPSVSADADRLVSTSFHNLVHPFIRYDTGDLVAPVYSESGRLFFRIKEGRVGDFIVDQEGRKLSLTSIIFGRHHAAFNDLLHLQVRQTQAGHITLLVVPRERLCDLPSLLTGFDFKGLALEFDVQVVDKPVRTVAGKLKLKVDA